MKQKDLSSDVGNPLPLERGGCQLDSWDSDDDVVIPSQEGLAVFLEVSLSCVEKWGQCGECLDPMWVIRGFAHKENVLNMRLKSLHVQAKKLYGHQLCMI